MITNHNLKFPRVLEEYSHSIIYTHIYICIKGYKNVKEMEKYM